MEEMKQKKKRTFQGSTCEQDYKHPEPKPDIEKVLKDVVQPTFDESVEFDPSKHAHLKYPPPKNNPVFVRKWKDLVTAIVARENFKQAHLLQLEVLCDLFVEYEQLSEFLRINGYTYTSEGRNGLLVKNYPQVMQLNRAKAEIRNYSKVLNIMLSKDKDKTDEKESSSWD